MLRAAQEELRKGRRVLLVDVAHQDDETAELFAAFDKYHPASGSPELLQILTKSPELVLIENLGARNVIGSRNRFRWADVLELLEEGIDVYTTLAAWQIEQIAVEVERQTGLRPNEIVPSEALMLAHEIRPVVCETDQVLRRLGFRNSPSALEQKLVADLSGTQELFTFLRAQTEGLARTSDVDERFDAYGSTNRLGMVCIRPTPSASSVLRQAYEVSMRMKIRLFALILEVGHSLDAGNRRHEYLDEAMQLAQLYGIETVTAATSDIRKEMVRHAGDRKPDVIFLGAPSGHKKRSPEVKAISEALTESGGAFNVYVIATDQVKEPPRPSALIRARPDSGWWAPYSFAVAIVALCTLVALVLGEDVIPLPKLLIYILGVMVVARRTGLGESLLAAALSLAVFDWLIFRETMSETSRLATSLNNELVAPVNQSVYWLVMLAAAAVMVSTILIQHNLKTSVDRARQREKHVSLLLGFTQEIADADSLVELGDIAGEFIKHHMDADSAILMYRGEETVTIHASNTKFELEPPEAEAAEEARATGQVTGASSIVMANRRGTYIPISDRDAIRGLLAIKCPEDEALDPNAMSLLKAFSWQLALAIDRMQLASEKEEDRLKMERQQIQNTLLSSVSHDLRSPLTVIAGAAHSLASKEGSSDAEVTQELASTIRDEADRLNQLVQNLLDITKLKSGQIKVNREWCSIEEVIGSALQIVERQGTSRQYVNDVPFGLPLIRGDTVLLQQLILNLVENAEKYTPPEGVIEICAEVKEGDLLVHVMDEGPGIEPGMEEKIFEKFERGGSKGLPQGSGLGLAICRAIAEVHDGSIVAENRGDGGASFIVRLPIEDQPELPGE